ncbi:MAG: outer membrane beta-barrel protein [Steroidobacteraceae bacterium]
MKHGITAAFVLAGLTAAMSAQAQIFDNEAGGYVGGGVGEFKAEIDDFDDVGATIDDFDDEDNTFKVFGGYRANKWLAFELAYIDLGSPEDEVLPDTFAKVEADGFAPYIVGTIPMGFFEAFAKAGYYFYDVEASVESPLGDFSDDDSESDFTYSVGVGLNFLERFNVRLEYEQFDFKNLDDSNALWLTGAFRF